MLPWKLQKRQIFTVNQNLFPWSVYFSLAKSCQVLWAATFLLPWFGKSHKVILTKCQNCGNGHNCSGGCLRSFIYLLRLANPCRVIVTAHTELPGPVTVPSVIRPPHRGPRPLLFKNSTWVLYRPKELFCARVLRRGLRHIVLIRED